MLMWHKTIGLCPTCTAHSSTRYTKAYFQHEQKWVQVSLQLFCKRSLPLYHLVGYSLQGEGHLFLEGGGGGGGGLLVESLFSASLCWMAKNT